MFKRFQIKTKKSSPGKLTIGIHITATMIKKETKYILIDKTLGFINCTNLFLKEYRAETKYA